MNKLLVKDDFTLMTDKVQSYWVVNATKNDTGEQDFLVCAVIDGNVDKITLDNPNVIILNLDSGKNGFRLRKHAVRFKQYLERDLCDREKAIIYLDDLRDEIEASFQKIETGKSTMVNIAEIPSIREQEEVKRTRKTNELS